jgi:hypothetical protein
VQPTCGRCKKANRSCVWESGQPSDQTGLLFKSENAFAEGKPRRPRGPKPTSTFQEPIPSTQLELISLTPQIPQQLSHPLQEQAFYYWIENFMFRLDDLPNIGHEYTAHVLSHWIRAKPGSSLHWAFSAISHAVFGKKRGVVKAIQVAEKSHEMAIVKTHQDMKQLSSESIDELLITIMLMSSYEVCFHGMV